MKEKEINQAIRRAFLKAAPDVLDSILSDCKQPEQTILFLPQKSPARHSFKWSVGIAAALLLFLFGITCGQLLPRGQAVAATISLDVNPSIEIKVNPKEKVLSVTARNEEARNVIGDMNFTGNSLDVTINALIGSMLRKGYLNETTNSILVSVDDNDPVEGAKLQEKLTKEIDGLLQTETFSGAVLSQTFSPDKELQALADTYGITAGKAQLIQQITSANRLYQFEDLVPLSINELNLLTKSSQMNLDNVNSVGTASDKAYIGENNALSAVLAHAGLNEYDLTNLSIELEYEHGLMVYDIDFDCQGYEYDYDVDALSGTIINFSQEADDDSNDHDWGDNVHDPNENSNPVHSSSYIGNEAALSAALSHAGVAEDEIYKLEWELDHDDGYTYYEIEFKSNGYEYEYEVDAFDGSILKFEKEWDD